jgi:hypothetical protein
MSNLLEQAVDAHGSLSNWNKLRSVQLTLSITGSIWFLKGKGDVLKDVTMAAETQRERLVTTFHKLNRRSIYEPNRIAIETLAGEFVESRDNPRAYFHNHNNETRWDDIDVAYFSSQALWTYLTIPFLYTYKGFATQEISPIHEEGEVWRRLWATFPEGVSSHTRDQVSCFGPDGLLRRHDYTVDLLGGARQLNFASRYRETAGIIVPTKRRVYSYEGDHKLVPTPPLIAIDITEVIAS